jgi:hypothetical protein
VVQRQLHGALDAHAVADAVDGDGFGAFAAPLEIPGRDVRQFHLGCTFLKLDEVLLFLFLEAAEDAATPALRCISIWSASSP